MDEIRAILKDTSLTYEQQVLALARWAENTIQPIERDTETALWIERDVICEMFEGNAPYRPRYIVPDYDLLMQKGSSFLRLDPPKTLQEAIHTLLIFYRHVPSITGQPVYIGALDSLLLPFVTEESPDHYESIKWFLNHIDRTITDSFCHGNLSGTDNPVARMILKAERELQNAIPNLTLKITPHTTDALLLEAAQTALEVAKPSFANDEKFSEDFGTDQYGIVSCYNGLLIGGGSYTLTRMNLAKLAPFAPDFDTLIAKVLPEVTQKMLNHMDGRVDFLTQETAFMTSNFLVKEGFLDPEKMTAMFGLVGLAELVNHFAEGKYGHDDFANQMGIQVIATIEHLVNQHRHQALTGTNGRYVLHAQVGIDTDIGISPGCRIPIGDEPALHDHIIQSAPFHDFFPSGIGDIFRFEETIKRNTQAVVDIVRGAFKLGLRYFSLYEDSADVVRITGYLVKKSDIEKLNRGEQVYNDAVVLGKGAVDNMSVLERKKR